MNSEEKIQKYIDNFRFQIVDKNGVQRSSTWTIRQNNSEDSLFIYPIAFGEKMKLSLHQRNTADDGNDSQWGVKNVYKKELELKGFSVPKPIRWKRPYDKVRVRKVATILFPADYMNGEVHQFINRRKHKVNIPMPRKGNAAEVSVFYSYNNSDPDTVAEHLYKRFSYTPIFYFTFSTGEIASVVVREITFDEKNLLKFGTYDGFKLTNKKVDESNFIHLLHFNKPQDGESFQICEVNGINVKI